MSDKTMNIKTEWDLSLVYKSINDPKIESDLKKAEKAYSDFEKKYKNKKDYFKNEKKMLQILSDYEKLADISVYKTISFLSKMQDLDSGNQDVRAKSNLVSQRLSKIGNKIIFFEVYLSKIPEKDQKKFLKSKKLFKYNYFLKKIFENGKYVLSEQEEKIISLKYLTSRGMWMDSLEKIRDNLTVYYNGEDMPISKASSLLSEINSQEERFLLSNKIMDKYKSIGDIAESEINAVVTDKKIDDELRGYKEPYDATINAYENDRKSILNLVSTVTKKFDVSSKFYKVKAKMLNLQKLKYSDRGAKVGKTNKKFSFEESHNILKKVFSSLDLEFEKILDDMVYNGQIDVYPKVGKRGGAYCSSSHKFPTYVMLNHTDSLSSLSTFAHEMGHAIHSEMSKNQPVLYEDYSIATAETASTLFESFVFYEEFEKLNDKEKIIALHDKIQDDISTIFRQIACFNFELEMHKTIRQKGNMTKEELVVCMNKHMKNYLGDKFELSDLDGYFFVGWSHIRNFFYVYSYAFGSLLSKALYKKYSEDKKFIVQIKKFLSLGGSMSPEDIFKSIGIDITKPDFFRKGIQKIEEDISLLEKLVDKK